MRRRGSAVAGRPGHGRLAAFLAVAVIVVGLTATGLIVSGLRSGQRENAERVMDQRAEMAKAAVLTETARYRSLLEATATGLATDSNMTWDDFDAATSSLANAGLKGASSVAFVVPATDAQIPAVQARWRSRGADGLVLRPAVTGQEHYFSIFNRGLRSSGTTSGIDLAAAREPAEAMRDARRMSSPAVSDTYVLLRDRNLPAAQQQHSFVFAAPIWPRTADPQFRGWMVLGMRGQDFLSAVLAAVSQGQLNGELLAANTDGSRPAVAHYFVPGEPDMERESLLDVADREWTLIIRADSGNLPGAHSPLPGLVLGGGIAITLIVAGLVYVLASARSRAVARVEAATRELRQAEQESRHQAVLLAAVMASIGDGVGVVDGNGEFMLHNPAAKELLGIDQDTSDMAAWQEHYGLFRPDGRTPFPHDELPLIRALSGESSNGVEMLVRNAGRPEGILISVDGRPLDPSAGEAGAVAVFHDITELRRYENDLAVFAGVVAHDLKAPLTVIRGHCEELLEDGEPSHSLLRIVRAVDRMAAMIDTLLAYTTARDAPLNFTAVDLSALVGEVVQDRTGHLPDDQVPDVFIGELPIVAADPAMLRHVLDNLIGNALKYVSPGSAARVDITAGPVGDGWTRVAIADRGIGIPDADKPAVFERFHRAHADAGYAGTGLGLAICKRIVERHGGEIGVADNPGGGTRFHFTLPLEEYAMKLRSTKKDAPTDSDDDEAREKLERALAERAAMENTRLPGLSALPSSAPSGGDPAGTRLRSPVPHHHPADPE
ncbi:ATP-binding protein [Paractinoplanes toevensis]|uniref:ATP-binding protein n=1 Tax=Paractinoplanes toevensis TaxID=571911 RepID=UPI001FE91159|nr:ATP-binding protein [Actinoplanes toevensis]